MRKSSKDFIICICQKFAYTCHMCTKNSNWLKEITIAEHDFVTVDVNGMNSWKQWNRSTQYACVIIKFICVIFVSCVWIHRALAKDQKQGFGENKKDEASAKARIWCYIHTTINGQDAKPIPCCIVWFYLALAKDRKRGFGQSQDKAKKPPHFWWFYHALAEDGNRGFGQSQDKAKKPLYFRGPGHQTYAFFVYCLICLIFVDLPLVGEGLYMSPILNASNSNIWNFLTIFLHFINF